MARAGFRELLQVPGAEPRVAPLLARVVPSLRSCLVAAEADTVVAGLAALEQLSGVVGLALNPHLKQVIAQMSVKLADRTLRDRVTDVLHVLHDNGGEDVYALIKSKVPTFAST